MASRTADRSHHREHLTAKLNVPHRVTTRASCACRKPLFRKLIASTQRDRPASVSASTAVLHDHVSTGRFLACGKYTSSCGGSPCRWPHISAHFRDFSSSSRPPNEFAGRWGSGRQNIVLTFPCDHNHGCPTRHAGECAAAASTPTSQRSIRCDGAVAVVRLLTGGTTAGFVATTSFVPTPRVM